MKNTVLTLIVAGTIVVSGCASTGTQIMRQEEKRHEEMLKAQEKQETAEYKAAKEVLKDTPDWVINPPRPDKSGIYAAAIGEHKNLQAAIRVSQLQSNFELAKTVRNELMGEETMAGTEMDDYRFIINSFVDRVDITGAEVVTREVVTTKEGYIVYTLSKLPYKEFNQVLKDYEDPEAKETIDEAYDRLMERAGSSESNEG